MATEIDSELLITFVELQPILWDKSVTNCKKNEEIRREAWKNVCIGLQPDFEEWNNDEQFEFYRKVKRRWIRIRECYMRVYKEKLKNPIHYKREYIYNHLLHFLQKLITESNTENCLSSVIEETERKPVSGTSASCNGQASCKRKHDEVEANDDETSEIENDQNSIILFFHSIESYLQNFDENDIIDFMMGVIQLIRNIKRNKKQHTQVIRID